MAIDSRKTMSKTQHYRKVTKPLLERKRRARMNNYLEELKDLIVETMESKGEHITKLEKADILELTVTFLKTKQQQKQHHISKPVNSERFREGYTQAAYEVSKVFASIPGMDVQFGTRLMKHLGYQLKELNPPKSISSTTASSYASSSSSYTPPQSPEPEHIGCHQNRETGTPLTSTDVWRPW